MNILGLDLGTKTGYAYNIGDEFYCGTWELATRKEVTAWNRNRILRRQDPRIARLKQKIDLLCAVVNAIVIEDVQFSTTTMQTQLWSSLRAAVWLACDCSNAYRDCVPVGTLKKFATGHGGATKEMMKSALRPASFPKTVCDFSRLDDDGVDACFVWLWSKHNLSRMNR